MERSIPCWEVHTVATVAAAPCSFGVFDRRADNPPPEVLLAAAREAGYDGIDLGPPGYLGDGGLLAERLGRFGLELAGGWAQAHLDDRGLAEVDAVLDAFDATNAACQRLPPRPTLAAGGPEATVTGRPPTLSEDDWPRFTAAVREAVARCRNRGYEPVFHHHVGTWVETVAHTDRLLGEVDVALCLDTGHLLLGGGDPLAALTRWNDRIGSLHLKDVHVEQARDLAARAAPLAEVWSGGVFCELGAGDVDVETFLATAGAYKGWVVVEQDRLLSAGELDDAVAAARRSRDYLRERGW
jgi:inosose dehydratase